MTEPVTIAVGSAERAAVHGDLTVPADAAGIVVFVHGSGSSRQSPRNAAVARTLQDTGLATLLFDLLTPDEERGEQAGGTLRFDVELLRKRLSLVLGHLAAEESTSHLPVGLFGASTGAGAALAAAAAEPARVRAVVSRGGRPDLAGSALDSVTCPTLLIVGSRDERVLRMNEDAAARLSGTAEVAVIAGATHLFEEPGALEQVAEFAGRWFHSHLLE